MILLKHIERKDLLVNGIYKIINTVNGKFYVGSCSSKTFLYERLIHHRQDLILNKHQNFYLQKSFNKYGLDNFYYEILETCLPEKCIEREQHYIDTLNPHYNLLRVAGSSLGRECKEKTRLKISERNKEFWKDPENRARMKVAYSKRTPRPKKVKVKKDFHGGCKKVTNVNTNEVYNSAIEASEKLKVSYGYVISLLNKTQVSRSINISYVS